jgi:hypothetical protein
MLHRICLVNPPYEVGESLFLAPQLGLLNIAAHLRSCNSFQVEIVDLALELCEGGLSRLRLLDECAHRLASHQCEEYGFSVQCFNLPIAVLLARRLRALCPARSIVFGGHEVALVRLQAALELPWIQWEAPAWFPPEVSDKWWQLSEAGPDQKRYRAVSRQAAGLVEVARGCPYSCSFCSIPAAFGHRRTYKPLSQVREEVLALHAAGVSNFHFVDDTLTIHRERLDELLRLLGHLDLGITWSGMTRVDLVDAKMLQRMASAGCYSLLYGVESADVGQRMRISKGGRPYPNLQRFVAWHLEAGIQATLYFLTGMPGETSVSLDSTLATAALLSAMDPGCCHFQLPRIVPGTQLHSQIGGRLELDMDSNYAVTLKRSLEGAEYEEALTEIRSRPNLYSTYYAAESTDPLARSVAKLGNDLFSRWPLTLVSLSEAGQLGRWMRSLSFLDSGDAADVAKGLDRLVSELGEAYEDIFRFERWVRDECSGSILSRIDADALMCNLSEGRPLVAARHAKRIAYSKPEGVATLAQPKGHV